MPVFLTFSSIALCEGRDGRIILTWLLALREDFNALFWGSVDAIERLNSTASDDG
jgi:hypothetical protein